LFYGPGTYVYKQNSSSIGNALRNFVLHILRYLLKPLLGRTRSRSRCWASMSQRPEPSGYAVM